MHKRFEPIQNRTSEIIEYIMSAPEIPQKEEEAFKIRLAVEEAVDNIVRYAYDGGDATEFLDVTAEKNDKALLTITLRDGGKPFNPLAKCDPNITLSAEEREMGGLGIFLCKKLMDSLSYRYEERSNILTMRKQLQS